MLVIGDAETWTYCSWTSAALATLTAPIVLARSLYPRTGEQMTRRAEQRAWTSVLFNASSRDECK